MTDNDQMQIEVLKTLQALARNTKQIAEELTQIRVQLTTMAEKK